MEKNIFNKFDDEFDIEGLQKDIKEASENGTSFKEVPHGNYEVEIIKLELVATKKEPARPMVSIWFNILDGEYAGSKIFMNQLVDKGIGIHYCNEFLRSLESGINIEFVSYNQYSGLLMDVHEKIDGKLEYAIEYGEKKGYNTFKVKEVFDK